MTKHQDSETMSSSAAPKQPDYWFTAFERSPYAHVVNADGRRLNRRLNVYMLLACFSGLPFALLAAHLGVSPLAVGIAYAAFTLAAFTLTAIWYVRTAAPRTRVVPWPSESKPASPQ